jgi:hypothetical protein
MQIPASPPDLHVPLIARRELQPVLPVTAVPGISEIAEHLDPQVALQWAQPVFKGQLTDPSRSALEKAIETAFVKTANPTNTDAPRSLASAIEWSTATPGLQTLLTRAGQNATPKSWPLWPSSPDLSNEKNGPAHEPGLDLFKRLASTYQSLKSSDVFAAQHLAQALLTPTVGDSDGPSPSSLQIQQWLSCLDPQSDSAQQATHMLMTGQMVWQGEISPGNAVRMQREDAWKESSVHPGQIEKGASLVVEITLPHLGKLKICGYKWTDQLDLAIQFSPNGKQALMDARPQLEDRLQSIETENIHTHWLEKA